MIELRLLRCAIALAEHKNFVRAAQACGVSQPSLSRNIQDIERRVGTQLFERATGGVVPTDAGQIFLEQAREVVARSGDLTREMDLLRGLEKGELCVGAGTYPSAMIVDQAITQFLQAHPGIRVYMKVNNRMSLFPLVLNREIDFAVLIVDDLDKEPDLHITRMNRHQGYFVVRSGHPLLASNKELTLQRMLRFPLAMSARPPIAMLRRFLSGTYGDSPVPRALKSFPPISCESVAMMKTIAAGTDAVTVVPLNSITTEVRSGQLVVLPLVLPWFQVYFGVVRMAHRSLSPVAQTFVRKLQEEDAKVYEFEQRAAAEWLAPPKRGRTRPNRTTPR
ncbi:MAG: LysR family transcriptional regulator [Steroidobacteraceae bacterium]